MNKFIVFAAIVAVAFADEIKFHDCANHEIISLKATGCSKADAVCKIHKGQNVEFEAKFTANQDTDKVELSMEAVISGVTIPVPGLDKNGCNGHNLHCPIKKGSEQIFKYSFNLPSMIPEVKADVVAKLIGANGQPMACFKLAGQVVV